MADSPRPRRNSTSVPSAAQKSTVVPTPPPRRRGRPPLPRNADGEHVPDDIRDAVARLKRDRIVASAVELFYRQGYERTTLEQLDLEKKRVEKGGGVAVDELQAATRLQIVRERRVIYEQGLRDAVSGYEQVFGKSPDLKLFEDVDIIKSRMPASVDSAIEDADTSNPRLLAARLATERTFRLISMENAGFMPNVDLVGTHNRERDAGQLYRKDEDSVLLKMSWNIFAGRETISRAQAAAYDYRESAEKEKNVNNKTKESVRVAWNQYKKGLERLELLESAVKTSQGVMRGRKRLRDAGKETALAVLDSEVEHFGLLANKVNASMDAKLGSYRLLSALGKLDIESLNLDQGKFEIPIQSIDKAVKELVGNELLVR